MKLFVICIKMAGIDGSLVIKANGQFLEHPLVMWGIIFQDNIRTLFEIKLLRNIKAYPSVA